MIIRICLILLTLVFPSVAFSQNEVKKGNLVQGKRIVLNAQKVTGADRLDSGFDALHISAVLNQTSGRLEVTRNMDISLIIPGKILLVNSYSKPFKYKTTSIWNGEKYRKFSEAEIMGRRIFRDSAKPEPLGKNLKGRLDPEQIEKFNKAKMKAAKLDPRKGLDNELWSYVFPLILKHPFEKIAGKFKYAGKAESDGTTANVVDVVTEDGRSIRLLFGAETNLLLLMIEKYKSFDGDYEKTYFYSDREMAGKILIPKKIKVEQKFTPTGKAIRISYSYVNISEFKINPKLKDDVFKIN